MAFGSTNCRLSVWDPVSRDSPGFGPGVKRKGCFVQTASSFLPPRKHPMPMRETSVWIEGHLKLGTPKKIVAGT